MLTSLNIIALFGSGCAKSGLEGGADAATARRGKNAQGEPYLAAEFKAYKRDKARVYLIDMIHVGPKEYFQTVGKISQLIHEKSENVSVLTEGIACSKNLLAVKDGNRFRPEFFVREKSLVPLSSLREADVDQMVNEGFLHITSCNGGQDGKVVDHKGNAAKSNLIFQYDPSTVSLWLPPVFKDNQIRYVDVDNSSLPPYLAIAQAVNLCQSEVCKSSRFGVWLKSNLGSQLVQNSFTEFTMKYRHDFLQDTIESELKLRKAVGSDAVSLVLPWHALHSKNLSARLVQRGFRLEENVYFKFANCVRADASDLDELYYFAEQCSIYNEQVPQFAKVLDENLKPLNKGAKPPSP